MNDDRVPRHLKERTGKHFCIRCLKEVPADEYFRNDHLCDECSRSADVSSAQEEGADEHDRTPSDHE